MSGGGNHDARLKHVEEVSKNARTTWFGMLGVLVFSAIAVAGVKDRDFFTYGVETALPLVGVTVPTVPFFYATPVLILAIYTYLHLYLLKLWRGLAALPATVTAGGERVPLDDAAYPWLLSDAAIQSKLDARHRPFGWLTRLVSFVLGWVAGPSILALFWIRSWPYHDEWMTLYIATLMLFAVWIGTASFLYAAKQVIPREVAPKMWRFFQPLRHLYGRDSSAAMLLFAVVSIYVVVLISWNKTEGPLLGVQVEPLWSARLYQAEIVARPDGWQSRGEAEEAFLANYGKVSRPTLDALLAAERDGAEPPPGESLDWLDEARSAFAERRQNLLFSFDKLDLSGADLRRADLRDAFLPGVRLVGARLGGADMSGAQMEGAVFSENASGGRISADFAGAPCIDVTWQRIQPEPPAIPTAREALGCTRLDGAGLAAAGLSGADLSGTDLRRADLSGADLRNSVLSGASVSEADLSGADFSNAELSGSDLSQTRSTGASFHYALLKGADLRRADLVRARLHSADLSGADMRLANLSDASLRSTDLTGAVLRRANLSGADLWQADFTEVNLASSILAGVDFSEVRGIAGLTLDGAIGDADTRLPVRKGAPFAIATCFDNIDRYVLEGTANSWSLDEEVFRSRYVCRDGTAPGRIEGRSAVRDNDPAQ